MRWYRKTGELFTEQITQKNGKLREANLRDARKLDLIPSVTSVLDILAKPGLVAWKEGMLIEGALRFTDDYIVTHGGPPPLNLVKDYIYEDFKQNMDRITGFGTEIHARIEGWIKSNVVDKTNASEEVLPFLDPLYEFLKKNEIRGTSERSFASEIDGMGYAGTIDLIGDDIITDFKTQKTENGKWSYYPESLWQLAAYKLAHPEVVKVRNIYISSTEPGEFKIKEYSPEEVEKAEEIFKAALTLFYKIKGL